MTAEKYIQEKFSRTKFRFIPVNEIIIEFGIESKEKLNQLARDGFIRKREGPNSPLIEVIKDLDV